MKLFTIVLLTCFSGSVFACTCFEGNKHSAQNLVFRPFVFEGKIISASTNLPPNSEGMIKALFKIESWLSPKSGVDTISVYTSQNSCGLGFSAGQSWLIFASSFDGRLVSHYCDRSVLKDNSKEVSALLQYIRKLGTGVHNVDDELKIWSGSYRLIGRLENGEPVGEWLKLRGRDTLAFYNFKDGTQVGMQMETDEETSPPERYYYELTRKEKDTLVFKMYDKRMKPVAVCKYWDGPFRIRYQSPYSVTPRINLWNNFKHGECEDLSKEDK